MYNITETSRLRAGEILKSLSKAELEHLIHSGVTHRYKAGEIIFREGGIPTGIYYIAKGRVKKFKLTAEGTDQIFYISRHGEMIGYHAVLSGGYYPDSAATLEEAEITFIPKEVFLNVLNESKVFSHQLLTALAHEFSLFINTMTILATKNVRQRLAYALLSLEDKFSNEEGPAVIRLSRSDLASIVGTVKESIVRLLTEFRKKGLIETNGKTIMIISRKGLLDITTKIK